MGYRSIAGLRIVDINAVQGDVRLIGACPGHVTFASDARLQAEQVDDIACFQRKLCNLLGYEVVAQSGILGIDQIFAGDSYLNHFTSSPDLQLHVALGLLPNQRTHIVHRLLPESFGFDFKPVLAGRDQIECKYTGVG